MSVLSVDDFEKIYISGTNAPLIRTGVIGDGSCYLHAVLTSMNYSEFRKQDRGAIVSALRQQYADEITKDMFLGMDVASVPIQTNVILFLESIAKNKIYKISPRLSQIARENKAMLRQYVTKDKNFTVNMSQYSSDVYKRGLVNQIGAPAGELDDVVSAIVDECEEAALQKYKRSLADASAYITHYNFKYIADKLRVNVILVRATGVYRTGDTLDPTLPVVILYYLTDKHFESVALRDANTRINKRVFSIDDPVVVDILSAQ